MLSLFDPLRELTAASIVLRMILPCLCGGLVGIEREFKRRPAGFRTHILICLGAAMTTLTSQYLALTGAYTDIARLGAQVVAGIGFIGAGTIIVTRHQQVKGLTTAAGLWVSAIVGLCLGAGFYEAGLFATALILLAETLFFQMEKHILQFTPEVLFYVEYAQAECLDRILHLYQQQRVKVLHTEITRHAGGEQHSACAIFSLRLNRGCPADRLMADLHRIEGIVSVEEL